MEAAIDEDNITPSDFVGFVSNIPKSVTEMDLKGWLQAHFPRCPIKMINYCYDIKDMVNKIRELNKINSFKSFLQSYRVRRLKKYGVTEEEAVQQGI